MIRTHAYRVNDKASSYATCIMLAHSRGSLTLANAATSELLDSALLIIYGLDAPDAEIERLTCLVETAIDAWKLAASWDDRMASADMALAAYWTVAGALDYDLPFEMAVRVTQPTSAPRCPVCLDAVRYDPQTGGHDALTCPVCHPVPVDDSVPF